MSNNKGMTNAKIFRLDNIRKVCKFQSLKMLNLFLIK